MMPLPTSSHFCPEAASCKGTEHLYSTDYLRRIDRWQREKKRLWKRAPRLVRFRTYATGWNGGSGLGSSFASRNPSAALKRCALSAILSPNRDLRRQSCSIPSKRTTTALIRRDSFGT